MGRNSMTRAEAQSFRTIQKTLPHGYDPSRYRGEDLETIYKRMIKNGIVMPCAGCGQPMEPFRDMMGAGTWRCHTINCANNPDDKVFNMDIHDVDTKLLYNHARVFNKGWQPHRIC
jgi:hypothetical protein